MWQAALYALRMLFNFYTRAFTEVFSLLSDEEIKAHSMSVSKSPETPQSVCDAEM